MERAPTPAGALRVRFRCTIPDQRSGTPGMLETCKSGPEPGVLPCSGGSLCNFCAAFTIWCVPFPALGNENVGGVR